MIRQVTTFLILILAVPTLAQEFKLRTGQAGLTGVTSSNGVSVADYNQDGYLDLYFVAEEGYEPADGATWNRLYRNNGDGTFSDVTLDMEALSKATVSKWHPMGDKYGAAWGDYDNDGYPDLFLTNVGKHQLYHNLEGQRFVDVTETAGFQSDPESHYTSAVWWDYDNDGDLDLYVSAWIGDNLMYENNGDGTFTDVTEASALADTGRTWTSLTFDADEDGMLDLYVVNDFGANRFYLNQDNGKFKDATSTFGLEDDGHGMGVTIGDCNNDGLFDIYLTNIEGLEPPTPNPLFINTGEQHFNNLSTSLGVDGAGWAWGTEFFDADHDGDEDLYVVNGFMIEPGRNYFFINTLAQHSMNFLDRSDAAGVDGEAEARGLAVFDYDNDGDLDLAVANFRDQPYLYENVSATGNWLQVELEGTHTNRDAFGAVVRVTAENAVFHRYHNGVEFLGQSIVPLHFGLGNSNHVDEIFVRWPDGQEESILDLAVNQEVKIKQGSGVVTSVGRPTQVPEKLRLFGNYPNPFNGGTAISFAIPASGEVQVRISNILGQEISSQTYRFASPGEHRVQWDATDNSGAGVSSGFYLYQVMFKNTVQTGRMLYLK